MDSSQKKTYAVERVFKIIDGWREYGTQSVRVRENGDWADILLVFGNMIILLYEI